jgi:dihydroxyacetone kinase
VDSDAFSVAVTSACKKIIENEPSITYFDTIVGDGDCGTTLARGATAILKWLRSGIGSNAIGTMLELTEVIENDMDGTSGAIYTIFFAALTSALKSLSSTQQPLDSKLWACAAAKALAQLQLATPARQGDRTLMDALEPFIHSLSIGSDLTTAAAEAKKGAESTIGMVAAFGRAVYVDDSVWKDVPDPGAMGVVYLVEGLAGIV